jgi:tetratricopeptide (TPR) repeat protein
MQYAAVLREGPQARELFEFALAYLNAQPQPTQQRYRVLLNYFNNRFLAADFEGSLRVARDLVTAAESVYGKTSAETAMAYSYFARANLKAASGGIAVAERSARAALAAFDAARERGPSFFSAQGLLGEALVRLGRLDEALPHLEASLAGLKAIANPSPPVLRAIAEAEARLTTLRSSKASVPSADRLGIVP